MRSSSRVWALAVACTMGVWSTGARAAEPAAPAVTAPSDVVLLKDGGMLRGTIAELVPQKVVVIVLVTGEKRTVSMADVEYAGPAAGAPAAAPQSAGAQFGPTPEATPSKVSRDEDNGALLGLKGREHSRTPPVTAEPEVKFESLELGLEVYVETGAAMATIGNWRTVNISSYSPLCTTPCTAQLAPGSHRFAVASAGGKPVPVDDALNVGAGDSVRVEYQSYSGMRVLGWLVLFGGMIGGTVLLLTSYTTEPCPPAQPGSFDTCIPKPTLNTGQFIAGTALALGGGVGGLILILKKDDASLRVGGGPTALHLNPMPREMSHPGGIAFSNAPGLVLSGTF